MEISKTVTDQHLELKITGRMDGYWANHLSAALDEEIRHGSHHIVVDLSGVDFLSSAGIGVLVKYYKELDALKGSFGISNVSSHVRKILELSALMTVLAAKPVLRQEGTLHDAAPPVAVLQEPPIVSKPVARITKTGAIYEVHNLAVGAQLACKLRGNPALLETRGSTKENSHSTEFPESAFAIGVGALGENYDASRSRFGEFIAAAGSVAYLPTDGTNVPDYFVSAGRTGPAVQICYSLACEGEGAQPFSQLVRFEAEKGAGAIPFSQVLQTCLEIAETNRLGLVMVAESAGLTGAALRSSPVADTKAESPFQFPGIRNFLMFTAERAHTRSVALVAGVVERDGSGELDAMVRPLGNGGGDLSSKLFGHFHAAAFSYRPLRKGEISLKETVKTLYVHQTLEGVLHLLNDDREIVGAGQSEFLRGACWFSPIKEVIREGARA